MTDDRKTLVRAGSVVVLVVVGVLFVVARHGAPRAVNQGSKGVIRAEPVTRPAQNLAPQDSIAGETATLEQEGRPHGAAKPEIVNQAKPQKGAQQKRGKGSADPPAKDELARAALSFVGVDPDAEEYWISAINNPNLSPGERSNLIEDLNEDGLSDPKHPSREDLPVIVIRLGLIEQLAGDAMDQANADAFQEAYKDLVNLARVAMGGGEPVR